MCRASAPTGKWDALPAACHSLDKALGKHLARLPKETPEIPSTDALEAGNCQKLMPGFLGAQAKNRTASIASVITSIRRSICKTLRMASA